MRFRRAHLLALTLLLTTFLTTPFAALSRVPLRAYVQRAVSGTANQPPALAHRGRVGGLEGRAGGGGMERGAGDRGEWGAGAGNDAP